MLYKHQNNVQVERLYLHFMVGGTPIRPINRSALWCDGRWWNAQPDDHDSNAGSQLVEDPHHAHILTAHGFRKGRSNLEQHVARGLPGELNHRPMEQALSVQALVSCDS